MSSFQKRLFSAVIAICILLLIFKIRGILIELLVYSASAIAVYELNNGFKAKGHKPNFLLGLFFVLVSIFVVDYSATSNLDKNLLILSSISIVTLVFYLFLFIFMVRTKNPIDLMINLFQILYVAVPMSMIMHIIDSKYFYLILIIPFSSDTFAYFTGLSIGKHKLAPNISPNKTIEGALGGLVGWVFVVLLSKLLFYHQISFTYAILLGIFGSIFAQMGDLTASILKRYCGIKDFGNLIPGHGGIIDRLDSIFFVIPLVFLFFNIFS